MRKLYVICTTAILFILLFHMFYMGMGLSQGVEQNEGLVMALGYSLMWLVILHGIYGVVKWMKLMLNQRKLKRVTQGRVPKTITAATWITRVQRITGIVVVVLVVPHTLIKIEMAPAILLLLDAVFMLSLVIHLFIGIPKWLVSTGLLSKRVEEKCSVFYGGKKK